mmetsp:Transcript_28983/g.33696  ORF Transcript_28983/g.33696 Transcript_28983/m.33696 type:complete len:745 (+) Transcript_28983:66-2300(+)
MMQSKLRKCNDNEKSLESPHVIHASTLFLTLCVLSSISIAFIAGRATSLYASEEGYLKKNIYVSLNKLVDDLKPASKNSILSTSFSIKHQSKIREEITSSGVEVPFHLPNGSLETQSSFEKNRSITATSKQGKQDNISSNVIESDELMKNQQYEQLLRDETYEDLLESMNHEKISMEQQQQTLGENLFIEIINLDSNFFLDSKKHKIPNILLSVAREMDIPLLSYPNCHDKVSTAGVSCICPVLGSYIALHTFPELGMITLDFIRFGSSRDTLPLIPTIEKMFGAEARFDSTNLPHLMWFNTVRGFKKPVDVNWKDLGNDCLTDSLMYKKQIASVKTPFQQIDIYDEIEDTDWFSFIKVFTDDEYAKFPQFFKPARTVWLDGIEQSTYAGAEAYHEALVQPAMIAHRHPKRVAIIGGGECATLREVLKHNTVENVKMIEIDEIMVEVSREYLPWSQCADIVGSKEWCGDDHRVDMFYEDALAWFNNRFSEGRINSPEYKEDPFDVLIMDALDPNDDVSFAEVLYTNTTFVQALYNALNDDGIIVLQLGSTPEPTDTADEDSKFKRRAILIEMLETVGFQSVHLYSESHCEFGDPWSFVVAMKDKSDRNRWFRNTAQVDLDIHKRLLLTHSGSPPLKFFDGALMQEYQIPIKAYQNVYCRKKMTPSSCFVSTKDHLSSPISAKLETKLNCIMKNDNLSTVKGCYMKSELAEERLRPVLFDPFLDRHLKQPHIKTEEKLIVLRDIN